VVGPTETKNLRLATVTGRETKQIVMEAPTFKSIIQVGYRQRMITSQEKHTLDLLTTTARQPARAW